MERSSGRIAVWAILAATMIFAAGCSAKTKGDSVSASQPIETQPTMGSSQTTQSAGAPAMPQAAKNLARFGFTVLSQPVPLGVFVAQGLGGNSIDLATEKGKVVVINFWATWCPPCREEMPSLESLWNKEKSKNFGMVAISYHEPVPTVSTFIKQNPYSFPIAVDPDGKIGDEFVGSGIPTSYIVDRNGDVVAGRIGGLDWSSPEVVSGLEALMK